MATEKIRVESDCQERVAFDLMVFVATQGHTLNDKDDALNLYAECLDAVQGRRPVPTTRS